MVMVAAGAASICSTTKDHTQSSTSSTATATLPMTSTNRNSQYMLSNTEAHSLATNLRIDESDQYSNSVNRFIVCQINVVKIEAARGKK